MENGFDKFIRANLKLWNFWTELHLNSEFYNLEAFKKGESSLKKVELSEVGEVKNKSLLHLQCHFGLDTLSWARLGADATGIDLSDKSISAAESLSEELGIHAEFICSDIYELPGRLDKKFDIVFTSYGTVEWLPDLNKWAQIIADFLKPDGIFYMVEFHPFIGMLDDDGEKMDYTYFPEIEKPFEFVEKGSYADRSSEVETISYGWTHNMAEIVTALCNAGLKIEFLHEFPYSTWGCWNFLEEKEAGKFYHKTYGDKIPVMFSIKAGR